jgi:glycosyltransferase involved in cell wall biosynthesis
MARADLGRTRAFERRLLRRFDRVLVTSPAEAAAFGELDTSSARERVAVIPNGVDLEYFQPRRDAVDPATIVFSGKLSYHANVAAGLWLAQRIMPLVWKKRPDATLVLAGKDPAPALVSLGRDPRVTLTGFLDDLRPVLARATVAAVPMVYGAGIQNKLLEAMASGVPVVASSVVASSLPFESGRDLLLADGTEALAASLVEALDDRALRERLSRAGRVYVETHHDWIRLGALLIKAYEQARHHWYGSSTPASPAASTQ